MQNLINEIENIIPTGRALSALLIRGYPKKQQKEKLLFQVSLPSNYRNSLQCWFSTNFSDINIKTLTTSSQNIIPKLTDDTAAVLVIYLYGHSTDIRYYKTPKSTFIFHY